MFSSHLAGPLTQNDGYQFTPGLLTQVHNGSTQGSSVVFNSHQWTWDLTLAQQQLANALTGGQTFYP